MRLFSARRHYLLLLCTPDGLGPFPMYPSLLLLTTSTHCFVGCLFSRGSQLVLPSTAAPFLPSSVSSSSLGCQRLLLLIHIYKFFFFSSDFLHSIHLSSPVGRDALGGLAAPSAVLAGHERAQLVSLPAPGGVGPGTEGGTCTCCSSGAGPSDPDVIRAACTGFPWGPCCPPPRLPPHHPRHPL